MATFHTALALMLVLMVSMASADETCLLQTTSDVRVRKAIASPSDDAATEKRPALLATGTKAYHEKHSKSEEPFNPNWFGAFADGESTYNYDGTLAGRDQNPQSEYIDGWYPQQTDTQAQDDEVRPEEFFWESKSAGPQDAFQAFFPPQRSAIAGGRTETGTFYIDYGDNLRQEYLTPNTLDGRDSKIPASWFDGFMHQLDGFGRAALPSGESPKFHLTWKEKTVNTSLSCKEPGCIAKVQLQPPFDWFDDDFLNCRLSVFFHPTDFDDQYSGEQVSYVLLDNKRVASNCRPYTSGQNELADRPLMPCVDAYPIDHILKLHRPSTIFTYSWWQHGIHPFLKVWDLIQKQVTERYGAVGKLRVIDANNDNAGNSSATLGNLSEMQFPLLVQLEPLPLVVEAKIPLVVDENPYKGNLLSAVPEVTCLTNPKPPRVKRIGAPPLWLNKTCIMRQPLQCPTRGCVAAIEMKIDPSCSHNRVCTFDLAISPTDFDNDENNATDPEHLEYVSIDGITLAMGINPGTNPCNTIWDQNLTKLPNVLNWVQRENDYSFWAIQNHPIIVGPTGKLDIKAKITPNVDECASNGYLLDGVATVTCHSAQPHIHTPPGPKPHGLFLNQENSQVDWMNSDERKELLVWSHLYGGVGA